MDVTANNEEKIKNRIKKTKNNTSENKTKDEKDNNKINKGDGSMTYKPFELFFKKQKEKEENKK